MIVAWKGVSFVTSDGPQVKPKPNWAQTCPGRPRSRATSRIVASCILLQLSGRRVSAVKLRACPPAPTPLATDLQGAGSHQLQTNKKTRGGRETKKTGAACEPEYCRPFIDVSAFSGDGAFHKWHLCEGNAAHFDASHLMAKRGREETLAGLLWWRRRVLVGEEGCAHDVAKLPPLFTGR